MSEPVCRVLVADDDAMNRLVAVESLRYLGVEPVAVDSASEALQLLAEQPFDLVLLDVHMPDMSGIEAALRIRENEHLRGLPRLPVLALTASATVKDQQSCMDAGMDGVLTKPFRIEQLGELLKTWCPRSNPGRRPRSGNGSN
jgi:CheY-like chemotaxis protein